MSTRADLRAPVLVGAGQVSLRDGDKPSPVELTADAVRAAVADCGAPALLAKVQAVGVVDPFSWPLPDPALLLTEELGIGRNPQTLKTARGGTGPIVLLGALAERIAKGELDVAVLAGGEVVTEFMRAMREQSDLGWPENPAGTPEATTIGEDSEPGHALETASGLIAPLMFYPLFEHALRAAAGRTVEEQTEVDDALWRRYAAVARDNPFAWTPDAPEHPARAGEGNRMAAHPYPKLLTANIQVDQAAALVLTSAAAAADAGIPPEKWVHVHATATAHDHWFTGQRDRLDRSPALDACARAALPGGIDGVGLLDLYSCFPSAVQIAARELGLDPLNDPREPTVTGGLTFAGGPANNYVMHALATLVGRLREQPAELALSTGVGWYMTKHGVAMLGGPERVAEQTFAHSQPQADVDAQAKREIATDAVGATVETYTALYDRDGTPTIGILAGVTDDGRRTFGQTEDGAGVVAADPIGASARFDGQGKAELL